MVNTDGSLTIWTKSINMNEKKKKSFIEFMEEHPELFYDTTELDGLDNAVGNDSVTQKTIKEWETWLEEKMKKKE